MKILIADDQPRRYGRLINALKKIDVARDTIDFVSCADEARNSLQDNHYDLLILDILLPLRPESDPDIQSWLGVRIPS